jgi:hypothetical protein
MEGSGIKFLFGNMQKIITSCVVCFITNKSCLAMCGIILSHLFQKRRIMVIHLLNVVINIIVKKSMNALAGLTSTLRQYQRS